MNRPFITIEEAEKKICPYINTNRGATAYCHTTSCMRWEQRPDSYTINSLGISKDKVEYPNEGRCDA